MSPATTPNGQVAIELYEAVEPLAYDDANRGYATVNMVNAWGLMLEDLAQIVLPDPDLRAPWSLVYDADTCPVAWLPWLAQWVGVRIPPGLDEASTRLRIKETDGFKRGSVGAIMGAARQHLIGDRKVVLRERYNPNAGARAAIGNLLAPNVASIETSAAGWTGSINCTVARSTTVAQDGIASLRMTATANGDMRCVMAAAVPVDALEQYIGRIEFRAAVTTRSVGVYLEWLDASYGYIGGGYVGAFPTNTTSGWTLATDTGTMPVNAAYAVISAAVLGCLAGEQHFIDRAGLFNGNDATWNETDDAYHLTVYTFNDETPSAALVEAALIAQKPAGIILHYASVAGQDWQTVLDSAMTWADVLATYDNWADVAGTY